MPNFDDQPLTLDEALAAIDILIAENIALRAELARVRRIVSCGYAYHVATPTTDRSRKGEHDIP